MIPASWPSIKPLDISSTATEHKLALLKRKEGYGGAESGEGMIDDQITSVLPWRRRRVFQTTMNYPLTKHTMAFITRAARE